MKTTVHDMSKRPWGYETLVTVIDDAGRIWNLPVVTDKPPKTKEEIITKAEASITQWIANDLEAKAQEEAHAVDDAKSAIQEKLSLLQEKGIITAKNSDDIAAIIKG